MRLSKMTTVAEPPRCALTGEKRREEGDAGQGRAKVGGSRWRRSGFRGKKPPGKT